MRQSQSHGHANRGLEAGAMPGLGFGRFGRMFELKPAVKVARLALKKLADAMIETGATPTTLDKPDRLNENPTIPSGYTYFGQFVDHDITFDPTPLTEAHLDAGALEDFRTPALDLDCIYGTGPDNQPYLYAARGPFGLLRLGRTVGSPAKDVGTTRDLFRLADLPSDASILQSDPAVGFIFDNFREAHGADGNTLLDQAGAPVLLPEAYGTAILGDKRNDENKIVSQIHSTMISCHNKVLTDTALLESAGAPLDDTPAAAQERFRVACRIVRWHYQWVVLHDYLRKITMPGIVDEILNLGGAMPLIADYLKQDARYAYIPVEFSGAAYRFGHSMVRPSYALNRAIPGEIGAPSPLSELPTFGRNAGHFSGTMNGLPGTLIVNWGIDWGFFLEDITANKPEGAILPQHAYRIDATLASPLGDLPSEGPKPPETNLAFRNLLRGQALGLPSGEAVAEAMGAEPVPPARIWSAGSKRADPAALPGTLKQRADVRAAAGAAFGEGQTPLWYYILREAEYFGIERDPSDPNIAFGGQHLGPVGSRIVAETFIGLLWLDRGSFLHALPAFRPHPTLHPSGRDGKPFDLAALIRYALT